MYQKVDDKNAALIEPGTILFKYPLTGDPVQQFNDADKDKSWEYKVDSTKEGMVTATPEKVYALNHEFDPAPLKKTLTQLVAEGKWWMVY